MASVALLTGLRRGELFALRWKAIDLASAHLTVREAVTRVHLAARRRTPASAACRCLPRRSDLLKAWQRCAKRMGPDDLVFATWSGKPISPNNVLRRWIFTGCTTLGIPKATCLTVRRTYSLWAHDKGVPGQVLAELMGHAKIDTTLNVYTQVIDASKRAAAQTIADELFTIVHSPDRATELRR
jgi:integrase